MEEPKREPAFDRSMFDVFAGLEDAGPPANPVEAFWRQIERSPREWNCELRGYDTLMASAAAATREDLRRALSWLEAALGLRARTAKRALA